MADTDEYEDTGEVEADTEAAEYDYAAAEDEDYDYEAVEATDYFSDGSGDGGDTEYIDTEDTSYDYEDYGVVDAPVDLPLGNLYYQISTCLPTCHECMHAMCHMMSCESIVMPPDESGIDEPEEDEEEVDINIDEGFLTDSAGNSVDLAPAAETVDTRAGQPSNVAAAPALGNTFVFFFCALGGHNAAGPVSLVDMIQTGTTITTLTTSV